MTVKLWRCEGCWTLYASDEKDSPPPPQWICNRCGSGIRLFLVSEKLQAEQTP